MIETVLNEKNVLFLNQFNKNFNRKFEAFFYSSVGWIMRKIPLNLMKYETKENQIE